MGDSPQAGRFFYYTGGVLAKSISQRNLMDCVGDDAHIVPRKWRRQTCPRIASHIVPRICSGAVILCIISRAAVSKPSGGIRSLPSLSAWGLPTPVVALACSCNVVFLRCYLCRRVTFILRRLQVYLFIIFHVQLISQGVTLLFFFTEKKKRSKKRKEFAFHLYYKVKYHTKITHQQRSPGGAYRRLLPP